MNVESALQQLQQFFQHQQQLLHRNDTSTTSTLQRQYSSDQINKLKSVSSTPGHSNHHRSLSLPSLNGLQLSASEAASIDNRMMALGNAMAGSAATTPSASPYSASPMSISPASTPNGTHNGHGHMILTHPTDPSSGVIVPPVSPLAMTPYRQYSQHYFQQVYDYARPSFTEPQQLLLQQQPFMYHTPHQILPYPQQLQQAYLPQQQQQQYQYQLQQQQHHHIHQTHSHQHAQHASYRQGTHVLVDQTVPSSSDALVQHQLLDSPTKKDWFEYLLTHAHQRYNSGDYSGAYQLLKELYSVAPTHLPTILLMGCSCYSLGMHQLSIYYNNLILNLNPKFSEAYSNLGTTYRAMGGKMNMSLAEKFYRTAISIRPNYWDASVNLAGLLSAEGRWKESLSVYDHLEQGLHEIWEGEEVLLESGMMDDDLKIVMMLNDIEANRFKRLAVKGVEESKALSYDRRRDLYYAKGNLYYAMGEFQKSKREYFKALLVAQIDLVQIFKTVSHGQIPPPMLTTQHASLALQQIKQKQQSPNSIEMLPCQHPTISSVLQSVAKIYQDRQQNHLAVAIYYASLGIFPTANTCNNIGILLAPQRLQESIQWYQFGLSLDPNHVHLYTNLGSALKDNGQMNEGIQCYQRAIALQPDFYIALANLANVYKDMGKVEEAIDLYQRALHVKPDFVEAFCNFVNSLLFICSWKDRDVHLAKIRNIVAKQLHDTRLHRPRGVPTVLPFHTFTYSSLSADMVREISRRNAERVLWNVTTADWFPGFPVRPLKLLPNVKAGQVVAPEVLSRCLQYPYPYPLPPPPSPQIRIGYVSSDFNNHPLAHLMQSVFGLHDRSRFKVYCYSLSSSDNSPYRHKIQSESDVFLDVGDWKTQDIVQRIALVDQIHVLVNLNGYTKGGRNEIFAARPAPIMMMYMGFAGSMGSGRADVAEDNDPSMMGMVGWHNVDTNEDRRVGNRTQMEWEHTQFFDEMPLRWMDYFGVDEIAVPKKFAVGEPVQVDEVGTEVTSFADVSSSSQTLLCRGPITSASDDNRVYTERLIFMPHSYFVNDHRQGFREQEEPEIDMLVHSLGADSTHNDADTDTLTPEESRRWKKEQICRSKMRRELFPGIKEDTIIFANFNQLYKIDPDIFKTWLNILVRVPNSILWLLRFPPTGEAHLRQAAVEYAGQAIADRIIFTDVAPKHVHIHRGRVADLFLDTPECNAHTTAADILWSGTPILTFPKYDFKMCSRVAASCAYATGKWVGKDVERYSFQGDLIPDLNERTRNDRSLLGHWMVVSGYKEYEERAVLLASQVQWQWRSIGVTSNGNLESSALAQKTSATIHSKYASSDLLAQLPAKDVMSPFYSLTTHSYTVPTHQPPNAVKEALPTDLCFTTHIFTPIVHSSVLMKLRQRLFLTRDSIPLFDTHRWVRYIEKGILAAWTRWEQEWEVTKARNFREVERIQQVMSGNSQTHENGLPVGEGFKPRRTTTNCIWIEE